MHRLLKNNDIHRLYLRRGRGGGDYNITIQQSKNKSQIIKDEWLATGSEVHLGTKLKTYIIVCLLYTVFIIMCTNNIMLKNAFLKTEICRY